MALVAPHLSFPLRHVNGRFVAVEQGSPRHVQDMAEVVLRTTPGDLEATPDVGLRNLLGTTGAVGPTIVAAIERAVPEARFLAEEDTSQLAQHVRNVAVRLLEETEG